MIKNRTAQLIYQTIYVTLGLVGMVACLGIFDNIHTIRWDFYVHFTNISNFLCIGVMLAGLIQTAKKKEDSFVSAVPMLKFIGIKYHESRRLSYHCRLRQYHSDEVGISLLLSLPICAIMWIHRRAGAMFAKQT